MTAGEVMDRAAALLNDRAKSLYTYTAQIPILKNTLVEFESECYNLGLPKVYKWSGNLSVTALATVLASPPADLQIPVLLFEKDPSQTDDYYVPMNGPAPLSPRAQDTILGDWDWIEDAVSFVGATVARSVKMYYQKTIAMIVDENSTIFSSDVGSLELIALWQARNCAIVLGGSEKRANSLEVMRQPLFNNYIGPKLGIQQSHPVRRIPYGGNPVYPPYYPR